MLVIVNYVLNLKEMEDYVIQIVWLIFKYVEIDNVLIIPKLLLIQIVILSCQDVSAKELDV